jgi:protein-S-isoprenylcysteine O-methyltransferase Ste14
MCSSICPHRVSAPIYGTTRNGTGKSATRGGAILCSSFRRRSGPLIFLVVAAALSLALGWPKFPGLPFPPLGIALVAIAFIPPVWAVGLFRREGTEIDPTSPTNRKLVTRGPYRFTRNPMYLGLITLALGIAIWVGPRPMFLAPIAVFATTNFVHIPFEEAKMRLQFGPAYDDYVARVRRWL